MLNRVAKVSQVVSQGAQNQATDYWNAKRLPQEHAVA